MDSGKPFQRFDVLFDTLIKKNNTRNRIKDWKNLMVKNMLFEKSELFEKGVLFKNDATYDYDENRWLSDAFVNFDKKKSLFLIVQKQIGLPMTKILHME